METANRLDVTTIKAGDILVYHGCSGDTFDYVFRCDDGRLGTSAVNPSWIERGLRYYGQELYPIQSEGYLLDTEVIGHYGDGSAHDGIEWYNSHRN